MFLANLEKLDIYTNLLIMIKPDSNKCVLQCVQSGVSAVLNNSLDIINALEHFTMASVNSSE